MIVARAAIKSLSIDAASAHRQDGSDSNAGFVPVQAVIHQKDDGASCQSLSLRRHAKPQYDNGWFIGHPGS